MSHCRGKRLVYMLDVVGHEQVVGIEDYITVVYVAVILIDMCKQLGQRISFSDKFGVEPLVNDRAVSAR